MLKDIKKYVHNLKAELAIKIVNLKKEPTLAIVQVGNVEASNRYVKNKIKDCEEVGIICSLYRFEDPLESELLDFIANLNEDGIIVQLPLPKHISQDKIMRAIPLEKDVDGFNPLSKFDPCTPKGIIDYLDFCKFDFNGKNAIVLGRSEIVGKPVAQLLLKKNCTVTICHSKTNEEYKKLLLQNADLVICAVGKEGVIKTSDAPNAVIIDVGINFNSEGKLCGDVICDNEFDTIRVTPVPGGVGLLTRCALLENTYLASKYKQK